VFAVLFWVVAFWCATQNKTANFYIIENVFRASPGARTWMASQHGHAGIAFFLKASIRKHPT